MAENFVSVSGISTGKQLEGIRKISTEEELSFPIAIGYQLSNKSINKGTQNPRQPKFVDIGELDERTRDNGFVTAIHYYTKYNETILDDLEKVVEAGVDPSRALLQFNTLPVDAEVLNRVRDIGFRVIFKVAVSDKSDKGGYAVWKGDDVQDVIDGDIIPLIEQVFDRADVIDYLMFDPSHGTNLDLDLDEDSLGMRFGREIFDTYELRNVGLVYAGGINPGNVRRVVKRLESFFPGRFSIDTESGVRKEGRLDLGLVRNYLVNYRNTRNSINITRNIIKRLVISGRERSRQSYYIQDSTPDCLDNDPETLAAFVEGCLSDKETERYMNHMEKCKRCLYASSLLIRGMEEYE